MKYLISVLFCLSPSMLQSYCTHCESQCPYCSDEDTFYFSNISNLIEVYKKEIKQHGMEILSFSELDSLGDKEIFLSGCINALERIQLNMTKHIIPASGVSEDLIDETELLDD